MDNVPDTRHRVSDPDAAMSRRRLRRNAIAGDGGALVATTALFASLKPKLPPFTGD